MKKNKNFTVSVFGASKLMGIVITDGTKAYPKSTWYDYSNQVRRAIELEHSLASSGHMRPEDIPSIQKGIANQRSRRKTDVQLYFSASGNIDRVRLEGNKRKRQFLFDFDSADSFDPIFHFVKQVIGHLA